MGRTTRHLSVIATAVAVIAIAGIWSVGPSVFQGSTPLATVRFPVLSGPFSTTYDFVTPSLGWALVVDYSAFRTRFFVFKTTDGAAHWVKQHVGPAIGDRTYMHFFNDRDGFVYVGYSYGTADGGDHWKQMSVPGYRPYVTFATASDGWAEVFVADRPMLFLTHDRGDTWQALGAAPSASGVLQPLFESRSSSFRGNCEGWLGAMPQGAPRVFVTSDCGLSWTSIRLAPPPAGGEITGYQTSVNLLAGTSVMVFVRDDMSRILGAYLSSDRGTSWRAVTFPAKVAAPDDIQFVDASRWWMLSAGSIFTTADAGLTWREVHAAGLPAGWSFGLAQVADARHAWWTLVSSPNLDKSALTTTSDGGAHWNVVEVPVI